MDASICICDPGEKTQVTTPVFLSGRNALGPACGGVYHGGRLRFCIHSMNMPKRIFFPFFSPKDESPTFRRPNSRTPAMDRARFAP